MDFPLSQNQHLRGYEKTPFRGVKNAACGDAQRRVRGLPSPRAGIANAAAGVFNALWGQFQMPCSGTSKTADFVKNFLLLPLLAMLALSADAKPKAAQMLWPDGSAMDAFFSNTTKVDVERLGKQYVITDYGVKNDSLLLQTDAIQAVIDLCAKEGGGVVVVPEGTFLSGSLFFKQGTNLYVKGRIKGSDRIRDFRLVQTRLEGQTLQYFAALINADGLDGFCIMGDGARLDWAETPGETGIPAPSSCIDGNGFNYWEEFWYRRMYNKACTNLEAMRPRLVYLSNCKNVTVQDVNLINSPFWTNHLYRCEHVRYLDNFIYAPTKGVVPPGDTKQHGAPSSDAIDLDVCHDVLVHGCYMQVNDDAVVLKGGKGTWADKDPDNGPVYNVLVRECRYGKTHGCLTLGSESLHDWNIVLADIHISSVNRVLWLKMRPDTPQHYEKIRVENVSGTCASFLVVRPWTQFFQPGDRPDMPLSQANDITFRNIDVNTDNFLDVGTSDKYKLRDFNFENCKVRGEKVDLKSSPFIEESEGASPSIPLKERREGTEPFCYSVPVEDGNYKVTVTLGSKKRAAHTVVRAESRRLMVESCSTRKGQFQTFSFIVNKRSPVISTGKGQEAGGRKVSLKPRELDYLNWDDMLTLEFSGSAPAVESVNVERDTTATTIFLCGNSTVVDQEEEPWASWGQMVPRWFTDKVAVSNHAESGLSLRSFMASRRLEKVLSMLKAGDYVLCEFGHNDQKEHGAGDGAWYSFQYHLKQFIDQVRAAGGIPVFVTPTQRRSFDQASHTKVQETHGDYPDAMRDVARREGVPVIELHDMTRDFFEALGFEGSKKALVHYPANTFPGQEKALEDNTHFNPYGAFEVAKMVVMGMKQLGLPIVQHLRSDWQDFEPRHPDDPDAFRWFPARKQNITKPDGN